MRPINSAGLSYLLSAWPTPINVALRAIVADDQQHLLECLRIGNCSSTFGLCHFKAEAAHKMLTT